MHERESAPLKSDVRIDVAVADCRDWSSDALMRGLALFGAAERHALMRRRRARGAQAAKRYIVSRLIARWLAEQRLTKAALAKLSVLQHDDGRPYFGPSKAARALRAPLALSISDTEHFVAVAVGDVQTLGVDIELIGRMSRRPQIARALAKRFFGPEEFLSLVRRAPSDAAFARAFVALWVQKEALVKGMGAGLGALRRAHVLPLPKEYATQCVAVRPTGSINEALMLGLCLPKCAAKVRIVGHRVTIARQFVA